MYYENADINNVAPNKTLLLAELLSVSKLLSWLSLTLAYYLCSWQPHQTKWWATCLGSLRVWNVSGLLYSEWYFRTM